MKLRQVPTESSSILNLACICDCTHASCQRLLNLAKLKKAGEHGGIALDWLLYLVEVVQCFVSHVGELLYLHVHLAMLPSVALEELFEV